MSTATTPATVGDPSSGAPGAPDGGRSRTPSLPPRSQAATRAEDAAPPADAPPGPPPQLEGYQVLDQLGGGGMGTVWRAVQMSTRRQVALKLMNPSAVPSERARRRFDREVEITALLEHPNIARIYDSGVHQGIYFYAMELIDGVPLDVYVRRHRLGRREVLALVCTACQALQHAHQRGVIHRDLKPSNILVDGDGKPHLVDFGLAKVFGDRGDGGDSAGAPAAPVTLDGEWAGTPVYMSPEQAAGQASQLDTRTDVYSMGALLYELLTGRPPHDAGGGHVEVMRRIVEPDVLRPRRAARDLDADLESLLLKALSKSPDDRYPSGGALGDDIANYLKGEPLTARYPTAFYFLKKRLRKHRLPFAAVATVIVALVSMGVHGSVRVARQRDAAAAAARGERELRVLAELRLADGLIGWGDALSAESRWGEAREKYADALHLQRDHRVVPVAAPLGLLRSYERSPLPILDVASPKGADPAGLPRSTVAFTGVAGKAAAGWVDATGRLRWYALSDGREIGSAGEPVDRRVLAAHVAADGRSAARVTSGGAAERPAPAGEEPAPAGGASLQLLDASDGSVRRRVPLRGYFRRRPAFSADGRRMAYVRSFDVTPEVARHELVLYDLAADQAEGAAAAEPRVLAAHDEAREIVAQCFTGDGQRLVTVTAAGAVTLRDVATGQPVGRCEADLPAGGGFGAGVERVAASPAGEWLALGGQQGDVVLVAPPTAEPRPSRRITAGSGGAAVGALAFSPDGRRVVAGDEGGAVRVWDVADGRELISVAAHDRPVNGVYFSDDGTRLATVGADGHVRVWPLDENPDGRTLVRHPVPITCVAVSDDGRLAAFGDAKKAVHVVGVASGKVALRVALDGRPAALAFGAGGATLCTATDHNRVTVLDLGLGKVVAGFPMPAPRPVNGPAPLDDGRLSPGGTAFSKDRTRSLGFGARGSAAWDLGTGRRTDVLDLRPTDVACFAPDGGSAVLVIDDNGTHRLRVVGLAGANGPGAAAAAAGEVATPVAGPKADAIAVAPGGDVVVVGNSGGVIEAFELPMGKRRWRAKGHAASVGALSFTADGRTVLSGGRDGTLRLWDASSGREVRAVAAGPAPAFASLAADGSVLAGVVGDGRTLRVWDLSLAIRREFPTVATRRGGGTAEPLAGFTSSDETRQGPAVSRQPPGRAAAAERPARGAAGGRT